jgi:hypothetical protein
MAGNDITTTIHHVQWLPSGDLHGLITSNDIRDNYVSELRRFRGLPLAKLATDFRKNEWLTSFHSRSDDDSIVARWDDTVYELKKGIPTAVGRPCEAITRVVGGPGEQIYCTCYWGLVQWFRKGEWTQLEIGREVDLFCALAVDERAFWVCGTEGTLARWNGRSFDIYELPTDSALFGLAWHPDGDLVVCGEGVVFKGKDDEWTEVYGGDTTFHFARAAGEVIYLCGGERGLFRLHGDSVATFDDTVYAYHCDVSSRAVVCCGANKLWLLSPAGREEVAVEHLF